ncbi:MAG: hypothetical protein ACHQ01_02105 [Candidatus Limnocylindrales bacterium]
MVTVVRSRPLPTAPAIDGAGVSDRAPVAIPVGADSTTAARRLDLNRVGVVFVHGIGSQPACETFLDWSGSLVDLLSDWRTAHGWAADPVRRCEYDLSGAKMPILEVEVPEYDGHPAQSWVMTEAWWAATTRAPGLSSMTSYMRRALPGIIGGIRQSYSLRAASWEQRRTQSRAFATAANGYVHSQLLLAAVPGRQRDWIDMLDRAQRELTILALGPALILGRLILLAYAPFRAIPIKPLQNMAALRSADNVLTRWLGELPDIINDPIQSANVRSRLVAAIRGLRAEGCGRIVLVAHSGGAIVSFTTLCDPAYMDVKVDKLVTLGEGLALAWRIENAYKGLPVSSRLAGDLSVLRPDVRWSDFWSSYDPAPAGPIAAPAGVSVADRSNPTVNRMSILEDHGSYWDNDEEFLIPLLREIDAPAGVPEDSRFYRDDNLTTIRLAWRRRRVAVLALWRWIATLGAVIPVALATAAGLLGAAGVASFVGRQGPERLGAAFAGAWAQVPGHQLIQGPLDGLAQTASWPGALPLVGEWAMGVVLIAMVFLVLSRIGVGRWEVWDMAERQAARRRVPGNVSGWRPALTFGILTAVTVALSIATFAYLWR